MRAIAYLLGARALDAARDAGSGERPVPDLPPGPIATTPETASAWRRWAQAGDAGQPQDATKHLRPNPVRQTPDPRPSPA
jgi:hypothetical protein